MPLATQQSNPALQSITDCYIVSPNGFPITARVLPEITDSKSASYADEPIIGRSFGAKTFGHGENRSINVKWHFVLVEQGDDTAALQFIREMQSFVYPMNDPAPYAPPPILQIKCGSLLASDALCVVMKSYSINFPTEVPWSPDTFLPYKFDMDMNFDVVYQTSSLPGQEDIMDS